MEVGLAGQPTTVQVACAAHGVALPLQIQSLLFIAAYCFREAVASSRVALSACVHVYGRIRLTLDACRWPACALAVCRRPCRQALRLRITC
jgi:hypothetical protein